MNRIAVAIAALKGWRRLALALAAGGASALALAPLNLFPVLFATIPVLVWLLDAASRQDGRLALRIRRAAAVGWWFGFGYFLGGLWWIGAAFLVDAEYFAWALPFAVILVPAGLALFWALGAGAAALVWSAGPARLFGLAAIMAAAEWLRGHAFTGFPWNAFGYTLTPAPVMMQSAALVGVWGITLAAFVIFAAPAALASTIGGRPTKGGVAFAVFAALLLAGHLGYGAWRLGVPVDAAPGPTVRVVQPALDQSEKWQVENEDEIVARYLSLSAAPGLDRATLLIWPESAFPFLLSDRPDVLNAIADLLPAGTTLITGAVRADDPRERPTEAFNSVLVIDERGTVAAAYDKVHLVPFGEYLPFRSLFEMAGIRQMVAIPEGFTAGATPMILTVPGAPSFAPLICYEIIFPRAVVPPGPRPGWLLNLTNDAWFGDTPGPHQHLLQGRVRAVEEGLPLVRAANSGISAIVDSRGRIVDSLGVGLVGTIDGRIPEAAAITPYTRHGDHVFLGFLGAAIAISIVTRVRVRAHRN